MITIPFRDHLLPEAVVLLWFHGFRPTLIELVGVVYFDVHG